MSFLDAFLKGEDRGGWLDGSHPPMDLILRKGDVGYNNPAAERAFKRRFESEWPLARTQYAKFYLKLIGSLRWKVFLPCTTTGSRTRL